MRRSVVFVVMGSALAVLAGCSGERENRDPSAFNQRLEAAAADAGPSAAGVMSGTYTLSGPSNFTSTGPVSFTEAPTTSPLASTTVNVSIALSGVPAGQGYDLSVTATTSDDGRECDGDSGFDVAQQSASLNEVVQLKCGPTGKLNVTGAINLCPVLDDLSAAPLALTVGGVCSLSVHAHDPDSGPHALTYAWSVDGTALANQTGSTLNFTCDKVGDRTLAVTVSDGDPKPTCAATASVKVSCQ
jgi:hypothetical protein